MSQSSPFSRSESGRNEPLRTTRPAVSYLVRFWVEPQDQEGVDGPYRGYVRDLETGEERYFSDPMSFAEHLLRQLRAANQATDREPRDIEDASGGRATVS